MRSGKRHGCAWPAALLALLSGCACHQGWVVQGDWSVRCVKVCGDDVCARCCKGQSAACMPAQGPFMQHGAKSGIPRFHPVPTHDVLAPGPSGMSWPKTDSNGAASEEVAPGLLPAPPETMRESASSRTGEPTPAAPEKASSSTIGGMEHQGPVIEPATGGVPTQAFRHARGESKVLRASSEEFSTLRIRKPPRRPVETGSH